MHFDDNDNDNDNGSDGKGGDNNMGEMEIMTLITTTLLMGIQMVTFILLQIIF